MATLAKISQGLGSMPLALALLLLLLVFTASPSVAEHWTYDHSGTDWGEECLKGSGQSPINIVTASTVRAVKVPFKLNYSPRLARMSLFNNGHSIQLIPPAGSRNTLTLADGVYDLLQAHGHVSSEHMLDGMLAPFEIHYVHQSRRNSSRLAVVGVLYALSASDVDNAFVNSWLLRAPRRFNTTRTIGGRFNLLAGIKPDPSARIAATLYTYRGSLTTPSCGQVVQWFVMNTKSAPKISQRQAVAFMDIISEVNHGDRTDNRPVQPLHGRKVYRFSKIL